MKSTQRPPGTERRIPTSLLIRNVGVAAGQQSKSSSDAVKAPSFSRKTDAAPAAASSAGVYWAPTKAYIDQINRIMNKCETLLQPGAHRLINIAGVEMVMYRTTDKKQIALQTREQFSHYTSGGFFVGRDSPAICFMKKDGQFITTMSDPNLREADRILKSLETAIGA